MTTTRFWIVYDVNSGEYDTGTSKYGDDDLKNMPGIDYLNGAWTTEEAAESFKTLAREGDGDDAVTYNMAALVALALGAQITAASTNSASEAEQRLHARMREEGYEV